MSNNNRQSSFELSKTQIRNSDFKDHKDNHINFLGTFGICSEKWEFLADLGIIRHSYLLSKVSTTKSCLMKGGGVPSHLCPIINILQSYQAY